MRTLEQVGLDPKPGDTFESGGQVYEVIGLDGEFVIYRASPLHKRRPSLMSRNSWRALANETYTEQFPTRLHE